MADEGGVSIVRREGSSAPSESWTWKSRRTVRSCVSAPRSFERPPASPRRRVRRRWASWTASFVSVWSSSWRTERSTRPSWQSSHTPRSRAWRSVRENDGYDVEYWPRTTCVVKTVDETIVG
jgi:hypothetical protein